MNQYDSHTIASALRVDPPAHAVRKPRSVHKMITALTLATVLSSSGAALAGASPELQRSAAAVDAALASEQAKVQEAGSIELLPHTMTIRMNADSARLDDAALQPVAPALLREGRVYFPIVVLEQMGLGDVRWNKELRQAEIHFNAQSGGAYDALAFRDGMAMMYTADGSEVRVPELPAAFIEEGRLYVPIRGLAAAGISPSYAKGTLSLTWSDKRLALTGGPLNTEGEEAVFTLLVPERIHAPDVLRNTAPGFWVGDYTRSVVETGIERAGVVYERIEYRVPVLPGGNTLEIHASSIHRTAQLQAIRSVEEAADVEVAFTPGADKRLDLAAPAAGYVRLAAGEALPLRGEALLEADRQGPLHVNVYRYAPEGYSDYETRELRLDDGQFDEQLAIEESGTYLVQLRSPRNQASPGGPVSEVWARFVVEVN
ncbi:hypothetical protein IDH44_01110 [Paenibacillus sp. IB182496]|uniref:Copper amine oxidase N-terminal domain-containing protein n=1 Tax=Paenibacillus sabuli TaxID=2772509 RepID=A0A927BQE0_9BACL|nr:hypothetical protein [Paenibacillus sabuli]MBD2843775.1 hypothetical protein [Paenibacillus sabuli]